MHMGGVAEGIFPASLVDGEVRVAKVNGGRCTSKQASSPWGSAVTCVVAAGLLAGCQSGGLVANAGLMRRSGRYLIAGRQIDRSAL